MVSPLSRTGMLPRITSLWFLIFNLFFLGEAGQPGGLRHGRPLRKNQHLGSLSQLGIVLAEAKLRASLNVPAHHERVAYQICNSLHSSSVVASVFMTFAWEWYASSSTHSTTM